MAKKNKETRPRLSPIDFFRLHGREFFLAVYQSIEQVLGDDRQWKQRWSRLDPRHRGLYAWWRFWGDVENGGLSQFFFNCTDAWVPALDALLVASGNAPMAALLNDATKIYRKHKKEFAVENPFGENGLFARMTELAKLDRPVGRLLGRTAKELEKWLRANSSLVVLDAAGGPIDPKFTGELETYHPNGNVFEQATVRRGVVSGPYHRYFDDGTLEQACHYKSGEISGDYWPNGQPKNKTMKRGKLKIHEWYYPSGNLHKRYVADKTGYSAVEPVRVWHENGQLAEEIHMAGSDKYGPWLKFFEDGLPRLQAEHRKKEVLVVKNAWDDQRRQVVKNGRGTYFDDSIDFSISYNLKSDGVWPSSIELRDGIPHGAGTTWHQGLLSIKSVYANGKLELRTHFYENGRISRRTTFRDGKEIKEDTFPKFDNPQPAVFIHFEADAKLFAAWKQRLLDTYPIPRNLEKVQAKLTVPAFLQEVFERNLANSLRDDYEDWNTFNDGIAYSVLVNERGVVEKVDFQGSSPYSIVTVETYKPIVGELKFQPGRIRGHTVPCRVLVNVDHTFVEGAS
jgi:antitoxin component YwqK of YwqJK toxin-antitoxin module